MSNVYDNWERLVGAVIRREQLWQMFHDRSPSVSSVSSDFSFDSQVLDAPFDFSSRSGTPQYQLSVVENFQKKGKSVKKLGSSILEMRVKKQDAIQWMSYGLLPQSLRGEIRRYDKYLLIRYLPKDLSKYIMRHISLALLQRVPLFEKMDEQLLDAMCDRLKPVLYTKDSFIVREGDPVDEMLFIMRGKLLTVTTNGGRTGFLNSYYLKGGDFCGEELLTWALDPHSSSNLPISTRTVQALSKAKVFELAADDLKFVASQYLRRHGKQLRHTFRFYSQQWRTWAACFIQAAWRRYYREKLVESLQEEENGLQDALAKARMQKRISNILLRRPEEPDFTVEENVAHGNPNHTSFIEDYIWAARVIQLAWQNYNRKKLIREEAIRFQEPLEKAIMLPEPAEPDITAI